MTTSHPGAPQSEVGRRPAGTAVDQAKVEYLSEIDLFQDMTARDLEQLERSTAMTTCECGTVFYTPGETGEVLFILKKGRVSLYRMTSEGKKLVTTTVEPDAVFGEMSLIGQGMVDSFAEAAEDCTLCVMSRTDIERMLREYPIVSIPLLELLARRLGEAEERLADVAYKFVPSAHRHHPAAALRGGRRARAPLAPGHRRYGRDPPRDGDPHPQRDARRRADRAQVDADRDRRWRAPGGDGRTADLRPPDGASRYPQMSRTVACRICAPSRRFPSEIRSSLP